MGYYNEDNILGFKNINFLECDDFLNQLDNDINKMIWTHIDMMWTYIDDKKNSAYSYNGHFYYKTYLGEKTYPVKYILDSDGNRKRDKNGNQLTIRGEWGGSYNIVHEDATKEEVITFLITQLRRKKIETIKKTINIM